MDNCLDDTKCERVCQLTNEEIAHNIAEIRQHISDILIDAGRAGDEVTLLGACKTMDKSVTDYIIDNRLLDALGDNKVQELVDKYDDRNIIPWHFIGNLQTNKVKYIVGKVALIHSLDRESLAREIDKQAKKHGIIQDVLIELNLGHEDSKGGVYRDDLATLISSIRGYDNIRVVGLMTVMPNVEDKMLLEHYFEEYNEIFDELQPIFGDDFRVKSIGMSGDYEMAIRHGSNLVRIGRLIFGDRRYT